MATSFLQVRTNSSDKEQAAEILEDLGTNLSAVVNMLLKQIVLKKGIPFDISMPESYSNKERRREVMTTMAFEDMPLTRQDERMLEEYEKCVDKEEFRQRLIAEYTEA